MTILLLYHLLKVLKTSVNLWLHGCLRFRSPIWHCVYLHLWFFLRLWLLPDCKIADLYSNLFYFLLDLSSFICFLVWFDWRLPFRGQLSLDWDFAFLFDNLSGSSLTCFVFSFFLFLFRSAFRWVWSLWCDGGCPLLQLWGRSLRWRSFHGLLCFLLFAWFALWFGESRLFLRLVLRTRPSLHRFFFHCLFLPGLFSFCWLGRLIFDFTFRPGLICRLFGLWPLFLHLLFESRVYL